MKVQGKIKLIGDIQQFESGFKKVEFVLTTSEEYPQDIKFEVIKDKADNLIKFNKVGDLVDVSFNLRGNEYNGKYYVNLQAWKVFKTEETQVESVVNTSESLEEIEGDLPF